MWGPQTRKKKPPSQKKEKRKSVSDEEWACQVCTYLNKPLFLACEMCSTQRSFDKPKEEKVEEKEESFDFLPDVTARMETLLETGKFADVTFIVGEDGRELAAHKIVLCARSPVFHAMLCAGFQEATNPNGIRVPDIEYEIFETMIRCMYTDVMDAEDDTVLQLLFVCDRFNFEFGKQQCIKLLRENLTVDNAIAMYDNSPGLIEDEKYILDFVDENAEDILHSSDFLNVSKRTVVDIVAREKLQIDEGDLFRLVLQWAECECGRLGQENNAENLKAILRDIVPHIRFPTMALEEFADISLRGILAPEDQLAVFQYLGAEESERKDVATPFLQTTRAQSVKKSLIWGKVHRFYNISSDKKAVTYQGSGSRQHVTAVCKAKLQSGRYRLRMEHRGGWTYSVGVCTDKHSLETGLGRDRESWALTYMGQLFHNNVERSGYSPNLSQCVIEIAYDSSTRQLTFRSVNQPTPSPSQSLTDHGLAYTLPAGGSYYLAVSMDYDTTATILGYNKDVSGKDWKQA